VCPVQKHRPILKSRGRSQGYSPWNGHQDYALQAEAEKRSKKSEEKGRKLKRREEKGWKGSAV
jgi:hypothetical protein